MIAVSANQIDKVALMPDREVYIISLVLGWIDVMPGTPFVFRPFPLVKGLINDEEAKSIAELFVLRFRVKAYDTFSGLTDVGQQEIMTHADGVTAHFL